VGQKPFGCTKTQGKFKEGLLGEVVPSVAGRWGVAQLCHHGYLFEPREVIAPPLKGDYASLPLGLPIPPMSGLPPTLELLSEASPYLVLLLRVCIVISRFLLGVVVVTSDVPSIQRAHALVK